MFYEQGLKDNACQTMKNFPEYVSDGLYDPDTCEVILKGIMKKGIIIAFQYITEIFNGMIPFYQLEPNLFLAKIKEWNKINNITEMELGYTTYTNTLEIYRQFLVRMFNEYH